MDENSVFTAYAIRRVNPFLGVLQVIQTTQGRAVSTNGLSWNLELRAAVPAGWGSLNRHKTKPVYCRYGMWSEEQDLVRYPLHPQLDRKKLQQQADTLIRGISQHLSRQPFPLLDKRELWLFDAEHHEPLALLASLTPDMPLPKPAPKKWSACLGRDGTAGQKRYPQAQHLEQLVKRRAGFNLDTRWIERDAEGRGLEQSGGVIEQGLFPPFLLREDWESAEQAQCVRDYLHWIAPSLLTLQHLTPAQRERMEEQLSVQAISIEHHWRLYPAVLEQKKLTAARVQSRLQLA